MRRSILHLGILFWLARTVVLGGEAGEPLTLKGGDRVVLVGSALIERDAESGYLETRVARRYPGRTIIFRNLGWTGDTVDGITRGKPNPPTDGFKKLVEHVTALQPTVIVLGYGSNEAFAGAAGLPAFGASLDRLWTTLAATGAKIVVLTPTRQENLGPPLPDPTAHNADLARYCDVLWTEVARRGAIGVDLFHALPTDRPWTTNGLHLSPAGYWKTSALIAPAFEANPAASWSLTVAVADGPPIAAGLSISQLESRPDLVRFRLMDAFLPEPACPDTRAGSPLDPAHRRLRVEGLAPGRYRLAIDGQAVTSADATAWRPGVSLTSGPEFVQVEALRREINRKNLLYFHRWRPQNETYLFGFRKHEQGRNAAELAEFDPLIAAAEAEIARLSRPVPHTYELVQVRDGEVTP